MTDKFQELKQLGLSVEEQSRTIVDRFVYILGYKIDLEDLAECLETMSYDTIHLTDKRMVEALMLIDVVASNSASWGASQGKNFEEFHKMIQEIVDG